MSRKPVTIIGAGRAGKRALEVLTELGFSRIRVIDPDPRALEPLRSLAEPVAADGVEWLSRGNGNVLRGEWLVPTLPVHLVFQWLLAVLGRRARQVEVPARAVADLPGLMETRDKGYTASLAQGLCPSDCDERKGCAWTRAQPYTLPQALSLRSRKWPLELVRSRALAPGLGGYPRSVLERLKNNLESRQGRVMVATACRCHGVIHALELNQGGEHGIQN